MESSCNQNKSSRQWAAEITQITPYLYLSGGRAIKAETLKQFGITSIINATTELPSLAIDNVHVTRVAISDGPSTVLRPTLHTVADSIQLVRQNGGRILVHCVAGVSRSPALVLAYLVKHGGFTLRHAFALLRQLRPIVRPSGSFFRQLIHFERETRGVTSVDVICTENGSIADVFSQEEIRLMQCSLWTDVIAPRSALHNHFR